MTNAAIITDFQDIVWRYYDQAGRHSLPWRQPDTDGIFDPYCIMVSELMLQQTQVSRVIPKYLEFLQQFPDITRLASASLGEVLTVWSGLGYNRRAKFLWQAAGKVVADFSGRLPQTTRELVSLPGIGVNTAGAILAYAYNQPVVFIETNVRTVFIGHFFRGQEQVSDRDVAGLVAESLPEENFREWYWALMDYGTHLKQKEGNLSRLSSVYAKQSVFQGSLRQIRGKVLKLLMSGPQPASALHEVVADERLSKVLSDLSAEGMIAAEGHSYRLS